MNVSLIKKIVKERELKNEKKVAIARLSIIGLGLTADILASFDLIKYSAVKPSIETLLIDFVFFSYSALVVFLLKRNYYFNSLKFFTITFDFLILTAFIFFDSTLPRIGSILLWSAQNGAIAMFTINLLRFSKSGTIYAGILSFTMISIIAFVHQNFLLDEFFVIFGNLLFLIFLGYLITKSNLSMLVEANTKQMMERYLPEQLVSSLYGKNASIEPGGTNQEVTILFSDLRSFTSISESLPAGEVVQFLNHYLSEMTKVIFSNNGTIDKFIGDAIMTIFGAPIQGSDDAKRAVITAIEMQKALEKINLDEPIERKMKMGIGIHTGSVIVGNIGSDKRLDYTVIGDNVNLCSRIEGLTKEYDCSILVSEATYELLIINTDETKFSFREIDTVVVKGRHKSIKIYEVLY